jgi:uncharacterized integral membrane protein
VEQPPEPESQPAPAPPAVTSEPPPSESRRDRAGRYAHHARLYGWAAILVTVAVFVVILVVENTRSVKVGWIFGHSRISLVYLVLFATLLGWLLGIATSVLFRRRARRSTTDHREKR